jgi:mRNA interferase RelE/StbE
LTYAIRLTRSAQRDLNRLPEAVAAAAVEFIFGALAENPYTVGKPLLGQLEGLHSARRGQYRIVYEIEHAAVTVTIIRVAHRTDVYR